MSLGMKTLLIVSVILACLIAASYVISSTILLNGFTELEREETQEDIRRVQDVLAEDLTGLNRTLSGWAANDETYAFVEDANPEYVNNKLRDLALRDLHLNLIAFVRSSGRVMFEKAIDLDTGQAVPIPPDLGAHLAPSSPLLKRANAEGSLTGLLLLSDNPMLVAAQPILTSEKAGPIRGTLIIGYYLNATEVARLSRVTHVTVNLYRLDDIQLSASLQAVRAQMSKGEPVVVQPLSADATAGYVQIADLYGNPALLLQVQTPRGVYKQGEASMRYLLLSLLGVGLVFGEATLILLERLVLSRLGRLSAGVSRIAASGDVTARVSIRGKDELAKLAEGTNQMLATLERYQAELQESQQELEKRVEERTIDLGKAVGRLAVVNRIARAASASLHLDDLMETVYQAIISLFRGDVFVIALYDQATAELDFCLRVEEGIRQPPVRQPLGTGLTAYVVTEKRPVLVRNLSVEQGQLPPAEPGGLGKTPLSWLGAPMCIGERVVGVISLQAYHPDAYDETEQRLLSTIADQVAVAVEAARLYTAVCARAGELALLNRIALSLTSTLDFSEVVRAALSQVRHLFQAQHAYLLQADSLTGELRLAQTLVGEKLTATPIHPGPGEGIGGWSLAQRQPVLVADAQNDPRFSPAVDQHGDAPGRALMVVPLLSPEYSIGVIGVASSEVGAYSVDDVRTLQSIASTLTVALVNARLYNNVNTLLREHELAQARLIQAEKMTALGRLIASITHEINNPLQSIQFCLTLVDEGTRRGQCTAETRAYLDTIRGEVDRISAIIQRMRDFYRPAQAELQATDVRAVLESVLELSGKQLQQSRVAVERQWAEDLPTIQANPAHLKQVFLNLVLNAIDAMPRGGVLRISAAPHPLPGPGGREQVPGVCLEFSDTGVGMAPAVLARLFEPFFTTKEDGAGLGLFISQGIIRAHHGRVSVDSRVAGGSTFFIYLPLEQPWELRQEELAAAAVGGDAA
jgi:signal transduction histidine kinase